MDRDGHEPLRSEDPATRISAVHRAAQAPMLEALVRDHIEFLEKLMIYGCIADSRTYEQAMSLVAASAITLKHARPAAGDLTAAELGQRELDLDAA